MQKVFLSKAVNNLKPDNRGASMVTVLITVAFLVILTTVLLFMSYTGYLVKASQAVGENRFYDAETAMDEVRAGLQGLVSDSIALAYSNVLKGFSGDGDLDKAFTEEFGYIFLSSEKTIGTPPTATTMSLFNMPGDNPVRLLFTPPFSGIQDITFELDFLSGFITDPNAVLSVTNPGDVCSVVIKGEEVDHDGNLMTPNIFAVETITIQGLRVTHVSDDDYLSIVDSDIAFGMPNLSYARSMYSFRGISNFAFIATGVMSSTGSAISVDGSAYFGAIDLTTAGILPVVLRSGTFISGGDGTVAAANGDVTVAGRELIVENTASLWARNVVVGAKTGGTNIPGEVTLSGNTYTAGSLILSGDTSSAKLAGRYYGFGVGGDGAATGSPDPQLSSSILVNSRENDLDLSELNMLFLAGHSFINPTSAYDTTNVLTGQSMAVKSDQLAYLIPVSHISGFHANPIVIESGSAPHTYEILFDDPLWGTSGADMLTLSDYIRPDANGIQTIRRPLQGTGTPGQDIFYVFMRFTEYNGMSAIENANAYFRDYFENNVKNKPDEVQAYLELYLDSYSQAVRTDAEGVTYTVDFRGDFGTANPTGVFNAGRFAEEYENRRRTLSREFVDYDFGSNPENPFHYVVKEQPPAGLYLDSEGDVRAVVSYGAFPLSMYSAHLSTIKIIISYGDVTVDTDAFSSGLILCDGNIYVNENVMAGGNELRHALRAVGESDTSGRVLGDYLNILISSDSSDETTDAWDFNELVYYNNWKKN